MQTAGKQGVFTGKEKPIESDKKVISSCGSLIVKKRGEGGKELDSECS